MNTQTQPEINAVEQADSVEQAPPKATPSEDFIKGLMRYAEGFLLGYIEKRIVEILQAKNNLELFNDDFEERVRDIAERISDEAIRDHERHEEHPNYDSIRDIVSEETRNELDNIDLDAKVSRALEDHDFAEQVSQAIYDYDFSDSIDSALDDYDFTEKVREALKTIINKD